MQRTMRTMSKSSSYKAAVQLSAIFQKQLLNQKGRNGVLQQKCMASTASFDRYSFKIHIRSLVKVKDFSMMLCFDIWYLITRQCCSSSKSASSVVILKLFKGYLRKYEIKSSLLYNICEDSRRGVDVNLFYGHSAYILTKYFS